MVDWSKPGCWGEWGTGAPTVAAGAEISLSRLGWKHKHISAPLPTAWPFVMTGQRVHCVNGLNSLPSYQCCVDERVRKEIQEVCCKLNFMPYNLHDFSISLFYNVGKYNSTYCCQCLTQMSKGESTQPFSLFLNLKHRVSPVNNQKCQMFAVWLESAELKLSFGNCLSMWSLGQTTLHTYHL